MHVLNRKSFAGPAALRSRKLTVLRVKQRTIASSMAMCYSDVRAYSNYILSLAKQRH